MLLSGRSWVRLGGAMFILAVMAAPSALGANEVSNPNMGGGTAGWTSPSTSDAVIASEGSEGNPSPSLRVTQNTTSESAASQCVDYDESMWGDGTPFFVSVDFYMDGFVSSGNTVGATFTWCSDNACSSCSLGTINRVGGSSGGGFVADTWYTLDSSGNNSPTGSMAMLVKVGELFGAASGRSTLIDNVVVGPNDTPVELISFAVE